MARIVSLLSAATEIAAALGLMDDSLEILAGILHPEEFPEFAILGHSLAEIGSNIL